MILNVGDLANYSKHVKPATDLSVLQLVLEGNSVDQMAFSARLIFVAVLL